MRTPQHKTFLVLNWRIWMGIDNVVVLNATNGDKNIAVVMEMHACCHTLCWGVILSYFLIGDNYNKDNFW